MFSRIWKKIPKEKAKRLGKVGRQTDDLFVISLLPLSDFLIMSTLKKPMSSLIQIKINEEKPTMGYPYYRKPCLG